MAGPHPMDIHGLEPGGLQPAPPLEQSGRLTTEGSAEAIAEMKAGVPYYRNLGVEHDVINASEGDYAFIEVEFK